MGQLFQLTPEQLYFVEVFVRCEGKITRMEEELGISYPTVRSRLHDVIRALGYEVGPVVEAVPVDDARRQEVLDDLAQGRVSSDKAIQLLRDL